MILYFATSNATVYAVQVKQQPTAKDLSKLHWLFATKQPASTLPKQSLDGVYVGPRAAMITPWSTNAVEITQNMGIDGITRIEEFTQVDSEFESFDPMISQRYTNPAQDIFDINISPEPVKPITDISKYNTAEGLALSDEEINYLENLSEKLGRPLTDAEVFGFSQVNSEHCRHKIFNGTFIIDGEEKPSSLFKLIKKTSSEHPNGIVSAYKDNVAFIKGPKAEQWAPKSADKPDYYDTSEFESVISLKAETHNFPTTVEPFNGAATGSGGEIRDRLAGGQGSIPLAGTAVYMTSYSRLEEQRPWEQAMEERQWLYQTPMDILMKASNGASDFGNKFGQPLITGSVLTFEHTEDARALGFDKVIMLAGGIGYAKANQALKDTPQEGDQIVILGGDNYRIGMGGAAVSSADTGEFSSGIELNAVQRSNPEMQKRAANAVRAMVESDQNPIVSIHDHGAGGHLNCLSELVEDTGGHIDLDKLPVGDPTLSAKEIIGNESQERMGLVISNKHFDKLVAIANRERSPIYNVGNVTGNHQFTFESLTTKEKPMDLALSDMFGSSPKTIMKDNTVSRTYKDIEYHSADIQHYLEQVLQLEAVACKDWLTNKVDRCVTGRVATQQCVGPLQLPLANCGVMAIDFKNNQGIATSIGHSPVSGLIDAKAGAKNSIAEALTNIIWAPLEEGLTSVSLSANWMWPCNNPGEDARLYEAVEAVSQFAINLGINVPTGKDSLSMKQKYKDKEVLSPGTVIISATAHCNDINKTLVPVFQKNRGSIYYINFSQDQYQLGGSSFGQILNKVGSKAPTIKDDEFFKNAFNAVQELVSNKRILAGHDVASGGLITTLLELCFSDQNLSADIQLNTLKEPDTLKVLFAENAGIVFQADNDAYVEDHLKLRGVSYHKIGKVTDGDTIQIKNYDDKHSFSISKLRDTWYKTSYLHDKRQSGNDLATQRFQNYKNQPLEYKFPQHFTGQLPEIDSTKPRLKAAIIREKGSNSEREMAYAMYLAGFDVKDVHMTDLISGREDLSDIKFIAAVGGFSNSDVLGSAKGWAGAFLYNEKANKALKDFFNREDTLSLGVCNGCQLFIELGLINPEHEEKPKMLHNASGKFECTFSSVTIQNNNSVMLKNMADTTLGIWSAHGEGRFNLPLDESEYHIVGKYHYDAYPANPNKSDYNTAILADKTGRHLVMMPHLERSTFAWNWAHYPNERQDEVSPWIEAFVNAKKWVDNQ